MGTVTAANLILVAIGLAVVSLAIWVGRFVPPRPVDGRMAAALLAVVAGITISIQAFARLI